MVNLTKNKLVTAAMAVVVSVAFGAGCGDSGSNSISVSLYGWLSSGGGGDFIDDIAQFQGAQQVRVAVTQPGSRSVIDETTVSINDRSANLPELEGGEGLRMDFELLDGATIIASGATPTFDGEEGGDHHGFRTMISYVDEFAPVGARFHDAEGSEYYSQSSFDGRQFSDGHQLGRVGHTVHPTDSGKVLIVGGAQLTADHDPATVPSLNATLDDIQIFDPGSGHFTELGGDSAAIDAGAVGQDRLQQSRAFHTVTPLGDDQFLVVGGFDVVGEATRPQGLVEVIDLNAEPGSRVQSLAGAELQTSRGLHTATLRESDGHVVIAGGLGASDDDVVNTVEVIDPQAASIETIQMSAGRVGHAAVLLEDDETVWLVGGQNNSGVLDSTETVTPGATSPSLDLNQPRYGAAAIHLGSDHSNRVLILGGFTSGGVTGSYEVGNPLQTQSLFGEGGWQIGEARGAAAAYILPQSRELLVIGGYDQDRNPLRSAERLSIDLNNISQALQPTETTPGTMYQERASFASSLVSNGRVILVGGSDGTGDHDNAEYYTPHDPVR